MKRRGGRQWPLVLLAPLLLGQALRLAWLVRHRLRPPTAAAAPKPPAAPVDSNGDADAGARKVRKKKFHGTLGKKVYCTPSKSRLLEAVGDYIPPGANVLCVSLDVETLNALQALSRTGSVVHVDMDHGTPDAPKPHPGVRTVVVDAWDLRELQRLDIDFDVAVLDVSQWSGRDSVLDTLSLVNSYWQGLPSLQGIILRSKAVLQVSQRLLDVGALHGGHRRPRLYLDRTDPAADPAATDPVAAATEHDPAASEVAPAAAAAEAVPAVLSPDSPEVRLAVDKIVCAVGVGDYRSTIPFVVREGDVVLEIGCQAGLTTKLIRQANRSGRVVGSDVAPASVEHARQQGGGSDVEWAVLDAWDLSGVRALGDWTVVYVDVSGISGRNSVLDALALVLSYFRLLPRLRTVVVKSRSLRDLAGRFARLEAVAEKPKGRRRERADRKDREPVPPTPDP